MASTLRKLADKLEGKDKEHDNPQSSNFGPHSNAAANKIDPTIDSDRDGRNDPTSRVGGYGNTQTTQSHTIHEGANTGPHNSSLANKLDPRVDSTQTQHVGGYGTHQTTTTSAVHPAPGTHTQSTNAGPHNSNLANKLDPRVDSDLDGRNNPTTHVGGSEGYRTTHSGFDTGVNDPRSTNAGPHSSNIMNKVDPRVDSDLDGHNNPTSHAGGYGSTQTGYNTTANDPRSTNAGPHSSNIMNKLDPRVDSDVDGRNNPASHVGGYGQTQTTTHSGGVPSGTHVESHTAGGAQGYTGTNVAHDDPRSTNTGPHSSNLLNKLDPRVDSDRDGRNDPTSRTGGYGQTQTGPSGIGRY